MEGVPDDVFQSDLNTFPGEDPRTADARKKLQDQAKKAQKAREAEMERERKKEAEKVKRAVEMPVQKPPAKAAVSNSAAKREMMAHKIRLYYEKLGHKLSSKAPKSLPRDLEGLQELLSQIECELHSAGGIDQATGLYLNGMMAFEKVTEQFNPLGLQISGPAASLSATIGANREQWSDLMTEVAIANSEWFMVGPVKRLLGFTAQIVYTVHMTNVSAMGQRHAQSQAPSEELTSEAEDL